MGATAMSLLPRRWRVLVSLVALSLLLVWPVVRWSRYQAQRADAIRVAARAYERKFGGPAPPYCKLPPDRVAHLRVRWDPSRNAYVIGFGYQYVDSTTRRDIWGRPIPFATFTVIESFAVVPGGPCIYLGHHSGGGY